MQRQFRLPLVRTTNDAGETQNDRIVDAEVRAAEPTTESPSAAPETGPTMEEVLDRSNMFAALKHVHQNKGAAGADKMPLSELDSFLKAHWLEIKAQLLDGSYEPQPVRRVEIDKADGGKRQLGIPTVLDRLIQQALLQILQRRWDGGFSEGSYGFRPRRSAHMAVAQAQQHVSAGLLWVVDTDLEKFFDRVNHDILMSKVAARVSDKRILKLIRRYLTAGAVLPDGIVSERSEGTPQGGPLSPLLANLLLDGFDKELERRGHRFVRYADDCNIYVHSERAGRRVMQSITNWLDHKLKLRVNPKKSAVALATSRDFLGFRLCHNEKSEAIERGIAPSAIIRAKNRIRELTPRRRGQELSGIVKQVGNYLRGWWGYFGHAEQTREADTIASWTRRRLRQMQWIQWKTTKNRRRQLVRLGCSKEVARNTAATGAGPWRIARSPGMHYALNNAYWQNLGLPNIGPAKSG